MIKKLNLMLSVIFISFLALINYNCSSQKIVAEIGDKKITLREFEERYLAENGYDIETAKNTPVENKISYLNSIVSKELKSKIGLENRFDTTEYYRDRLKFNTKILLAQTCIKSKLIEPNLKNYYEKMKYDVRVSQIFLPIPQDMSVQDSVKTYKHAYEIISSLQANVSFDSLAKQYSAEAETRYSGGDLYYITPGSTLSVFEFAVFNLNPGEVTKEPVRTAYGLHIIKMTDRKERYESVRVSHIVITDTLNEAGLKDSVKSYNLISSIKEKIKSADDFEKSAKEFSKDTITKSKGGDLGFVKRNQYAKLFDSTIFSLKPGQISGIIRTQFGWHIIKMTEVVDIKPFDDTKSLIRSQFLASYQFRKLYDSFVTELRMKNNLNLENTGIDFLMQKIKDTTLAFVVINPSLLFSEEDKKVITGRYNGGELTVNDLLIYISGNSSAAKKELTRNNLMGLVMASADIMFESKEAISEGMDKDENYLETIEYYKKLILSELVDKELIPSETKISDEEIQKYYNSNMKDFIANVNGVEKVKRLSEVKDQIIGNLKTNKFKETEELYLEKLKTRYNVKIYYDIVKSAFN